MLVQYSETSMEECMLMYSFPIISVTPSQYKNLYNIVIMHWIGFCLYANYSLH